MEVGSRLSDVFGADDVLWVEGPTEEECFPKILKHFAVRRRQGTSIIALRSTGEVDSARPSARATWEIYRRISTANALIPAAIGISLDRETRSQREMDDLTKESSDLIRFLPRRTYENYLLDAEAIAFTLSQTTTFLGTGIDAATVQGWIDAHAEEDRFFSPSQKTPRTDAHWLLAVNGAKLLAVLFEDLSGAREEYRKVVHSVWLTEWLLANRPDSLEEVARFIERMLSR